MQDAVVTLFERHALLSSEECLRCEVCCRFPSPTSPLAPFFANEEIAGVVAGGMSRGAFPPGEYGPGGVVELESLGAVFRCPLFRPESNGCRLYAERPLDCRLYPFLRMFMR